VLATVPTLPATATLAAVPALPATAWSLISQELSNVDPGAVITLTAVPNENAYFTGWSGSCSGTAPTCTVTMNGSRVVGAGFGWRAVARELLDVVPVAGWAVKAGIAYTGTRAIGEAAVRYFAARR